MPSYMRFTTGLRPKHRKNLLGAAVGGAVAGIIIAFLLPRYQRATLSFYPVNLSSYGQEDPVEQALEALHGIDIFLTVADSLDLPAHYHLPESELARAAGKLREQASFYRSRFSSIRIEVTDRDAGMASRIATTLLKAYEKKQQRSHRAYWQPVVRHRRRYIDSLERMLNAQAKIFHHSPEAVAFVSGEEAFNELAQTLWEIESRRTYYQSLANAFRHYKKYVPDSVVLKRAAFEELLRLQRQRFDSVLTAYPQAAQQIGKYQALLLVYQEAIEDYQEAVEKYSRKYAYAVIAQPLEVTSRSPWSSIMGMGLLGAIIGIALMMVWIAWRMRPPHQPRS